MTAIFARWHPSGARSLTVIGREDGITEPRADCAAEKYTLNRPGSWPDLIEDTAQSAQMRSCWHPGMPADHAPSAATGYAAPGKVSPYRSTAFRLAGRSPSEPCAKRQRSAWVRPARGARRASGARVRLTLGRGWPSAPRERRTGCLQAGSRRRIGEA